MSAAGDAGAHLDGVERIAVLRPSALGDFLFALPALHALKAAYPRARLTLLGKAWHRAFLQDRPGPIDEVVAVPVLRGVGAPLDAQEDAPAVRRLVADMRARGFDLALQMYGGGAHSNPLVASFGARVSVGMHDNGAVRLDRSLPYVPWQNERLRLLELAALAGAPVVTLAPPLALTDADERELARVVALPTGAPLAVLQPGATDPRRRWPTRCFAAVGDALADRGATVAINGSADEHAITAETRERMRRPALDLAGRLSVGGLAALLARARLLVSNDTGPLHLAQAVGCATVGIYWFSNFLVSSPPFQACHRHVVASRLDCPVCGADNLRARCAHDASFVADVDVDEVLAQAEALYVSSSRD